MTEKDKTPVLSKEQEKSSKRDLNAQASKYNILESLILAQDERWRRA